MVAVCHSACTTIIPSVIRRERSRANAKPKSPPSSPQVARLQVPVDHAPIMGELQAPALESFCENEKDTSEWDDCPPPRLAIVLLFA